MKPRQVRWPDGRRFAFTIVDDTDHATVANVRPIYELLFELGLRTTKTVWVFDTPPEDHWAPGETLESPEYREFVTGLGDRGFEIALHGVSGCSSTRARVIEGIETFTEVFGAPPRIHVNHAQNRDNVYWGTERVPAWRRRLGLDRGAGAPGTGHVEGDEHYWGDLLKTHVSYVRGLTFSSADTLACDPFMPYHDPRFPLVNAWFSASDGANAEDALRLLDTENVDALEAAGGALILFTHFGKPGFLDKDGRVVTELRDRLTRLANRPGWFVPAGEILDHLGRDGVSRLTPWRRLRLRAAARRARKR